MTPPPPQPSRRRADRTPAAVAAATPRRSGADGERLAAAVLARAGYRVVVRDLRTTAAEIDLLVRRGRTWIAVEVKARTDHPAPERFVDAERLGRLQRALTALAPSLRPVPAELRIDVVAVRWLSSGAELTHFPSLRRAPGPGVATGTWRPNEAAWYGWPTTDPRSVVFLPTPAMPTLAEQIIPRRKLLLILCENLIFSLVLLVGTTAPPLSTHSFHLFEPSLELVKCVLSCVSIALICQASLSYNDLYDWKTSQNRAELGNRLVTACGYSLVMMALLAWIAPSLFVFPGLANTRAETPKLILLIAIGFAFVYLLRHAFHWFFYKWRFGERVVVLGSSDEAVQLARMIADNPMAGFEALGIVGEPGIPAPTLKEGDPPLLAELDSLRSLCRAEGISRVVVALRERRGRVPVDRLLECRMDGVVIEEREAMYERLTGKLALESMRPSYLIYGQGFGKHPVSTVLKRLLDLVAALVGITLSLVPCLLVALAIKATSRGPVFFLQERTGQDGRTFRLVKFRTMRTDAERDSGPVWAQKNDARVTPVGRFLRLTRIDEIPQFWNILLGQMSFVGPRPERPHFVEQLAHKVPFYPLRHTVKPGLTGWAQVRHPYGASIDDAQEKLRYDLYYIKNMNPLFDLNIIYRTITVILGAKGAR